MINIVLSQMKKMLVPIIILDCLLMAIFAFLGQYNYNLVISIFLGNIYSLINFFMIGVSIAVTLSKTQSRASIFMLGNYLLRYVLTGVVIYFAIVTPSINAFGVVLPLFFPKISLLTAGVRDFKKINKKED